MAGMRRACVAHLWPSSPDLPTAGLYSNGSVRDVNLLGVPAPTNKELDAEKFSRVSLVCARSTLVIIFADDTQNFERLESCDERQDEERNLLRLIRSGQKFWTAFVFIKTCLVCTCVYHSISSIGSISWQSFGCQRWRPSVIRLNLAVVDHLGGGALGSSIGWQRWQVRFIFPSSFQLFIFSLTLSLPSKTIKKRHQRPIVLLFDQDDCLFLVVVVAFGG